MREIPIRGEMIRLGQLLKLAAVADSGAEAKELLAEGAVRVNGAIEQRRGRQLHDGDVVTVDAAFDGEAQSALTVVSTASPQVS